VCGTCRLSQPHARVRMAARAVLCADCLPERAMLMSATPIRAVGPRGNQQWYVVMRRFVRHGEADRHALEERRLAEVVPDGELEFVAAERHLAEARAAVIVRPQRGDERAPAAQLDGDVRRRATLDRVQDVGAERAQSVSSSRRRAILAISPSAVSISCSVVLPKRLSASARIDSAEPCSRTQTTNGMPNFSR
jgi:hypothetical protein